MNFELVLERLNASHELLSLAELSAIFGKSKAAIRTWPKAYGFPTHVQIADKVPTATRYWRPDRIIEWVIERQKIEAEGITIERVAEIVGVHPDTWAGWVAAGSAPKWRWVAIGSGHHLWAEAEVREWLAERTGGYQLPQKFRAPRETKARTSRGRKSRGNSAAAAASAMASKYLPMWLIALLTIV